MDSQLLAPGEARCFLTGAKIFKTMFNSFKLSNTFFQGGEKIFKGVFASPRSSGYGLGYA